jgi:phenylalanyl-tRNA synthetase alpha chain
MQNNDLIKSLHPLEVRVLKTYSPGDILTPERMEIDLGFNLGQSNQAISWLSGRNMLVEESRTRHTFHELTELGRDYLENGVPEEKILRVLADGSARTLPEIAQATGLENRDVGSAFGALSREGALRMDGDKKVSLSDAQSAVSVLSLRKLLERAADTGMLDEQALSPDQKKILAGVSKKRGASGSAFRTIERETVEWRLTGDAGEAKALLEAAGLTGDELGALTREMLRTGAWKNAVFRRYNVDTPPVRVLLGRRNPYCEYLEYVKDKLVSLGFQEFDGPLVETEFWNSDALFMPQFHSARDIHDVYYIKDPSHAREIQEPYLSQVASAHENGWNTGSAGWGYSFDRDFTRRLILRSQGTVMSAKTLPVADVPGKYFGILRCFRYDQVDATHLSDFYQTEGIVLGEDVNLRTLLGFLEMFAMELAGATEVKYVPGYFPFTEPSVEVHIKHPVLGWFELGGSGIFRPEVTEPLGVNVPVLAWGLGIDRMALMHLGLDDLRELFSQDIENVRLRRAR